MKTFTATALKVESGNSLSVEMDLGFDIKITRTVRLRDIDTPRMNSQDEEEAAAGLLVAEYVASVLTDANNTFTIAIHVIAGKSATLLADIFVGEGERLNDIMVNQGYAVKYEGGQKLSWPEMKLQLTGEAHAS